MVSKEDFEKIVNSLKEKLDDTTQALVSEELLAIISSYSNASDDFAKMQEDVAKLKNEKDELLKVNGRLYQKIGFDKEEEKEEVKEKTPEDEISVEDVIDEKGDLI